MGTPDWGARTRALRDLSQETSQAVGKHFFVGAHQLNHDLRPGMVIAREQRTQCAVNESHLEAAQAWLGRAGRPAKPVVSR